MCDASLAVKIGTALKKLNFHNNIGLHKIGKPSDLKLRLCVIHTLIYIATGSIPSLS